MLVQIHNSGNISPENIKIYQELMRAIMINVTIEEFLAIWPRVFPTMALLFIIFTIGSVIFSVVLGLISKSANEKRIENYIFQKGYPVIIYSFRGYLKNNGVSLIVTLWIAILLIPVISFLPIILFDASFLIKDLAIMGMPIAFLITNTIGNRFHKRFEKPRFYFFSSGLGIESFGNDLIIPSSAIKRLRIDTKEKWLAINIKARFFPAAWTWHYYQFDTQERLSDFRKKINLIVDLPWEDHTFSKFRYKLFIVPYKKITFINQSEMEKQINPKTQRILEHGQQIQYISQAVEHEVSFSYPKYLVWTSLIGIGLMLLPLLIPGIIEGYYEHDVIVFVIYSYIGIFLIALLTGKLHFQEILTRKPNFPILTVILGIVLFFDMFILFGIVGGINPQNKNGIQYLFANIFTGYIMGGFVVYYVFIETRFRQSTIQWSTPRCPRCSQIIINQSSSCSNCKQQLRNVNPINHKNQTKTSIEEPKIPLMEFTDRMIYCPVCGKGRLEKGKFCITCGYEFIEKLKKNSIPGKENNDLHS